MQAGPGTLVLKDFKESEKLLQGIDVTDGRIGLLDSSLDQSSLEKEPFSRLISALVNSVKQARTDIDRGQLESAKARMYTVNEIVDLVDSILGDDELLNRIQKDRESEKKSYAMSVVQPLRDSVVSSLTRHEEKMQKEVPPALDEWDSMAEKKRKLSEAAKSLKDKLSELSRELDSIYNQMPSASATQDPEEANLRTKLRNALDGAKTTVTNLGSEAESLASDSFLQSGQRPETPGKVEMVLVALRSLRNELTQMMDSTKDKLA
jgi:hypothetical protein